MRTALLLGLLLVGQPSLAAPLMQVEQSLDEKEQLIRLQAQGPLPYEIEQKTPTRLVVFLPRAQLGTAPVFLSLQTGELSFEENSVGLRLRIENVTGPLRIAAGKRAGSLEIRIALTPPEKPTTTAPPQQTPLPPGPPQTPAATTGTNPRPTATTTNTPKVGDITDESEEDPDPPRPGVAPVPARPLPPP